MKSSDEMKAWTPPVVDGVALKIAPARERRAGHTLVLSGVSPDSFVRALSCVKPSLNCSLHTSILVIS